MLLKPAPKVVLELARTPQPWLEVELTAQSVPPMRVPLMDNALESELARPQPGLV